MTQGIIIVVCYYYGEDCHIIVCFLIADSLTTGQIVGIVIGAVVFAIIAVSVITVVLCCVLPFCPLYHG